MEVLAKRVLGSEPSSRFPVTSHVEEVTRSLYSCTYRRPGPARVWRRDEQPPPVV